MNKRSQKESQPTLEALHSELEDLTSELKFHESRTQTPEEVALDIYKTIYGASDPLSSDANNNEWTKSSNGTVGC